MVGNETTIFVYSSGKLIAEYSNATPTATPTTSYTTTDHLGSPRVITDATGQVKSRRDFMPFGEEIGLSTAQTPNRASIPQYGASDNVRQKFTGYLKDNETNLDFAEARYYSNQHGRFTAVDPLLASGKSANPQTFNRYVYTGNSPLTRIDPSGKDWVVVVKKEVVSSTKIVNGKKTTVEKTIDVRTPVWIPDRTIDERERASNVWGVTVGEKTGFQALHPTTDQSSEVFDTKDKAQLQFNSWVSESTDGKVDSTPTAKLFSWEPMLNSGHSALLLKNGTYISFYPKEQFEFSGGVNSGTLLVRDWIGQFRTMRNDFGGVKESSNSFKSVSIIKDLDEDKITSWFQGLQATPPRWSAGYNCSNAVGEACQVGGMTRTFPSSFTTPSLLRSRVNNELFPRPQFTYRCTYTVGAGCVP